jgi:hypothetical protein
MLNAIDDPKIEVSIYPLTVSYLQTGRYVSPYKGVILGLWMSPSSLRLFFSSALGLLPP